MSKSWRPGQEGGLSIGQLVMFFNRNTSAISGKNKIFFRKHGNGRYVTIGRFFLNDFSVLVYVFIT